MRVTIKELLRSKIIEITHEVGVAEYNISDGFMVMALTDLDNPPSEEYALNKIVWEEEFNHLVGVNYDADIGIVLCDDGSDTIDVEIYRKLEAEFFCG